MYDGQLFRRGRRRLPEPRPAEGTLVRENRQRWKYSVLELLDHCVKVILREREGDSLPSRVVDGLQPPLELRTKSGEDAVCAQTMATGETAIEKSSQ